VLPTLADSELVEAYPTDVLGIQVSGILDNAQQHSKFAVLCHR
jgi:hypothetical protein